MNDRRTEGVVEAIVMADTKDKTSPAYLKISVRVAVHARAKTTLNSQHHSDATHPLIYSMSPVLRPSKHLFFLCNEESVYSNVPYSIIVNYLPYYIDGKSQKFPENMAVSPD